MTEEQLSIKLGEKIRELRKAKKLTLVDLAYECGFEKSNLIRIEKGRTLPTTKTLLKIANALKIKINVLFD
jgi:transcriptional regulator with XRE-family HTH domain